MKQNEVFGVAIKVEDNNGKLLLINEGQTKIWKKKGQISVVMGTCEKINGIIENPENTIIRELKEEVNLNIQKENLQNNGNYIMYVSSPRLGNVKINIQKYNLIISDSQKKNIKINDTEEINDIFWINKSNLKQVDILSIRPGTIETLLEFNEKLSNIVYIENGEYHKNILDSLKIDLDNL